ncbi:hypothetical protein SBRCBS47491_006095 [Sporothrix bragantina]|uniref:Nonsense-mediated mRNA decay factor n=1 Tax=Sporothrix bragantina TaxID=671064 RepID=A0ABP0C329_9PEZI
MATTKMATAHEASEAETHWLEAKKITHSMGKKLEQIDKDESGSKKLLAELESVEHLLESLRLACMATTFTDFKFAHQNRVLDRLWHVHTLINAEYKKGMQRHRGNGQIVQFRTIEKQYAKHLKTAQYFYKGFIERLSARYRLRSLQRVAHTMQSGNLKISDVIDAEEAQLSHELTVACYRTVLHMGDIARYRLNASRQRGHNPDVAMTYYALAQDLMPEEGDAHHQMAVVLAEQRRDFDVVYHFLRSWSVQKPHALAPKNLASEFKKLLQPPSNSRKQGNAPPDAYEMFGSWLVRLHANYFKGEKFSSQSELEREVLHRWEALLKKAEQPAYLQKAVLLSIAAYDIALRRVKEEWTAASSQSCQFILQFLVRTILVVSRVLESEADHLLDDPVVEDVAVAAATTAPAKKQSPAPVSHDKNEKHEKNERQRGGRNRSAGNHAKAAAAAASSPDRNKQVTRHSVSGTCLSLFRVCMAWISIHKEDLVKFEEYLTPHIADMHRSVTRCLTLFIGLISNTNASPTKYLLPEDIEVIGLAPLDRWTALHELDADTPYKPHFDEEGVERQSLKDETMARLYDIVECTVGLVSYALFPWTLKNVQIDGCETPSISYSEERSSNPMTSMPATAPGISASYVAATATTATASPSPAVAVMRLNPAQPSNNAREARQTSKRRPEAAPVSPAPAAPVPVTQVTLPIAQTAITQPAMGQPIGVSNNSAQQMASRPVAPRRVSYKDMDDDDFLPGSMKEPPLMAVDPNTSNYYRSSAEPTADSEFDFLDSAAYSRVANFLSPPELHPHPAQTSPLQSSLPLPSSYGMHTSTIEDVFGQLQTLPAMGAPTAAPTTTAGTSKPIPSSPWGGSSYMSSLGYYPQQQQSPYGLGGLDRPPTNIEDQLAYLTLAKQQERQRAAAAASSSVPMATSSSSYGMVSSRGFPSALSPVGAAKQQQQQQQHSPSAATNGGAPGGFVNPWATSGLQNGGRLLPQQLQQAQAASLGINSGMGLGGSQQGPGSSPAMLYSSNFSMNNSMPSVQSPRGAGIGGLPSSSSSGGMLDPMTAAEMQQLQQMQHLQQQQHHLLQAQHRLEQDMAAAAAFNGYGGERAAASYSNNNMWLDASTAWGRGVPPKDDPTHFRNSVRHSGLMEETNAYDRNALLSALDDKNGPGHHR